MTTLCRKLVDLGVYTSSGPGRPSLYDSLEEAREAKRSRLRNLQIARRAIYHAAMLRGEEPPKLKRGRKPMYTSKAEAIAAKRAQDKISKERYNARLLKAIDKLARINQSSTESNSEHWEKSSSSG